MRITIELSDELLARGKSRAALEGVSLNDLFIEALEQKLAAIPRKVRRPTPPLSTGGPPIPDLTREQIEEAMFGSIHDALSFGR